MELLKEIIQRNMKRQNFDSIAVGVVDFKKGNFETIDLGKPQGMYFDLASLTKPLTLAATYHHHPDLFDKNLMLLLEHRAGLPAWGRPSSFDWKEVIFSYKIEESDTVYSDYSALRLMLELEKKAGKGMRELIQNYWDDEVCFWRDLPDFAVCPDSGFRAGEPICGDVNDDKAYVINRFTTHAGLFGTISGLCRTLLKLQKETLFLETVAAKLPQNQRFCFGWDTVANPENTLAGAGCSTKTFGHLGFTGTSIWIDPEKEIGHIILSNATQNYWYERSGLSEMRRIIGHWVWSNR